MGETWKRAVQDEIAVLQSIYMDELVITGPENRPDAIALMLHPYTADEEEKKFVCLQLIITLSDEYPQIKPSLEIRNPRGISEAQLESILMNLEALASQRTGEAMLFELIEYTKECLTDNNRPECACAICLDHFEDDRDFYKTECYHYFHLICMACYIKSFMSDLEDQSQSSNRNDMIHETDTVPCPICRTDVKRDQIKIDDITLTTESADEDSFELSEDFLRWRRETNRVFQKQRNQGGIIDIEAEKNKFLIQTKVADDVSDIQVNQRGIRNASMEIFEKKSDAGDASGGTENASKCRNKDYLFTKCIGSIENAPKTEPLTKQHSENWKAPSNTGKSYGCFGVPRRDNKQRTVFGKNKQGSEWSDRFPKNQSIAETGMPDQVDAKQSNKARQRQINKIVNSSDARERNKVLSGPDSGDAIDRIARQDRVQSRNIRTERVKEAPNGPDGGDSSDQIARQNRVQTRNSRAERVKEATIDPDGSDAIDQIVRQDRVLNRKSPDERIKETASGPDAGDAIVRIARQNRVKNQNSPTQRIKKVPNGPAAYDIIDQIARQDRVRNRNARTGQSQETPNGPGASVHDRTIRQRRVMDPNDFDDRTKKSDLKTGTKMLRYKQMKKKQNITKVLDEDERTEHPNGVAVKTNENKNLQSLDSSLAVGFHGSDKNITKRNKPETLNLGTADRLTQVEKIDLHDESRKNDFQNLPINAKSRPSTRKQHTRVPPGFKPLS